MKTLVKILKWTGITLLVLVTAFVITVYVKQKKSYEAPAITGIKAVKDSAMIARGRYLVTGPSHCMGCHNPIEQQNAIRAGEFQNLEGGFVFDLPLGKIYTPNLTSDSETGIGSFSDEQIARAVRYGIGHDGRALFPVMNFQNLTDEDLTAIVSFLRTLPPVKKKVPKNQFNFLGKAVYAFMIEPKSATVQPAKQIKPDTTAAYGEYLAASVSNCVGCHTNFDLKTGQQLSANFSGGLALESPFDKSKECVSPNLTPDKETGHIYTWSEAAFIGRLKAGRGNSISEMPWEQYRNFSENDLKAIYKYLKSLKPVKNTTGPTVREKEKA